MDVTLGHSFHFVVLAFIEKIQSIRIDIVYCQCIFIFFVGRIVRHLWNQLVSNKFNWNWLILANLSDFTVLEKKKKRGGTWREKIKKREKSICFYIILHIIFMVIRDQGKIYKLWSFCMIYIVWLFTVTIFLHKIFIIYFQINIINFFGKFLNFIFMFLFFFW